MLHFVSLINQVHFSYSHNWKITILPNVIVLVCQCCHTNVPRAGGFKQQKFSPKSGGWKSKIKVSAVLVSYEAFLLGLKIAPSCCALLGIFSLCADIRVCACVYTCVLITQSYPTLCIPMDCSPPGSSVHGILQARILEWVTMPSTGGRPIPRISLKFWILFSASERGAFSLCRAWEPLLGHSEEGRRLREWDIQN